MPSAAVAVNVSAFGYTLGLVHPRDRTPVPFSIRSRVRWIYAFCASRLRPSGSSSVELLMPWAMIGAFGTRERNCCQTSGCSSGKAAFKAILKGRACSLKSLPTRGIHIENETDRDLLSLGPG